MIEVHIVAADTQYKAFSYQTATTFSQNDANDGTFAAGNGELILIKQRNTGTNTVELHFARRGDDFKKCYLQTGTAFSCAEAQDGHFRLSDGYLYFIKVRNCHSNMVEIYRAKGLDTAPHPSLEAPFKSREGPFITDFHCADDSNGIWDIHAKFKKKLEFDLCLIKTANTDTHKVEYHVSEIKQSSCRRVFDHATPFWFETNGTYHLGRKRVVYFVKLRNSGSGKIEVMVGGTEPDNVRYFETCLGPEEANNGLFLIESAWGPEGWLEYWVDHFI